MTSFYINFELMTIFAISIYKNGLTINNTTDKITAVTGFGWLAERSNATVLKTADGATRPGVRIPHHPP